MNDNIRRNYLTDNRKIAFYKIITKHPDYLFYKAVKIHKKYRNAKDNKKMIKTFLYGIKANRISSRYNLELYGKFGNNLKIYHGNIVINSKSVIGNNVIMHGNNCIGEKNGEAPTIGNNVEIGYGAIIIGNVEIADDVIIGANSLVNKSFKEKGVVIAGCPAQIIKR